MCRNALIKGIQISESGMGRSVVFFSLLFSLNLFCRRTAAGAGRLCWPQSHSPARTTIDRAVLYYFRCKNYTRFQPLLKKILALANYGGCEAFCWKIYFKFCLFRLLPNIHSSFKAQFDLVF